MVSLAFGSTVAGQQQTKEDREAAFKIDVKKARWVYLSKDGAGTRHYIDGAKMVRIGSVVVFNMQYTKRGTTIYEKFIGGCTTDSLGMTMRFLSSPGAASPANWLGGEIEGIVPEEVPKGSLGYTMLDYACKKARIIKVD